MSIIFIIYISLDTLNRADFSNSKGFQRMTVYGKKFHNKRQERRRTACVREFLINAISAMAICSRSQCYICTWHHHPFRMFNHFLPHRLSTFHSLDAFIYISWPRFRWYCVRQTRLFTRRKFRIRFQSDLLQGSVMLIFKSHFYV